jgi:hypothetical protein
MQDQYAGLPGPDFLDAVAEAELHIGNPVNSDIFKQRAREWRQLQADNESLHARAAALQSALDNARNALKTVA